MRSWIAALTLLTPTAALAGSCTQPYGTKIEFHDDAQAAAALAKKQGRMLFVLHLSGELPRPDRT